MDEWLDDYSYQASQLATQQQKFEVKIPSLNPRKSVLLLLHIVPVKEADRHLFFSL